MTQDEIIEMAIQAGFKHPNPRDGYMGLAYDRRDGADTGPSLEAFAQLVASKEREACAKLVEDSWMAFSRNSSRLDITPFPELDYVAKVIRARGEA